MIINRRFVAILLLSLLLVLSSCVNGGNEQEQQRLVPETEHFFMFDTIVTVTIYDENVSQAQFSAIGDVMDEIDQLMNRKKSGSEIDQVNRHAGIKPIKVSEATFQVMQAALQYAEQSAGKFDPTIGPLVDLWGIGSESAKLPEHSVIEKTVQLVDFTQVVLDEAELTIYLTGREMSLDFGAIAKGYAGDMIAAYLLSENINSAIIDLGGNILAIGTKQDGQHWVIGIQDPQQVRGDYVGLLSIKDQTVVTSGIYERYFVEAGKHYHHILDTTNGYPLDSHLLSATIITDKSIDADALSTVAYAMGLEEGLSFIEKREATEAIFITKDKQVFVTSGLQHHFELTNHAYTLMPSEF